MRFCPLLKSGVLIVSAVLWAHGQETQPKDAQSEFKGLPARVAPTDYLSHAQAGAVTLAAEFKGHSVPTLQATFTNEDFVVVEAALYGPPGARSQLSFGDFSLRINGGKKAVPSEPYGLIISTLKDPEWEPPKAPESKGATVGTGEGDLAQPPPRPAKMPLELQRVMAQRTQKASFPEGDRVLPQAGLLYFRYTGRAKSIRTVELIYSPPGGKATTLKLQP